VSAAPRAVLLCELPDDALVRAEDVGRYIGCSARTVQRAGIPYVEITTRVRRYRMGDLRAWLEHQRRGAA
jgi:hypothetical protein